MEAPLARAGGAFRVFVPRKGSAVDRTETCVRRSTDYTPASSMWARKTKYELGYCDSSLTADGSRFRGAYLLP